MKEEQFVPYALSLKLKDLGFNEECFATYPNSEAWKIDGTEGRLNFHNSKESEYSILAPLWQQAFDWFMEKYKVIHSINSDAFGYYWELNNTPDSLGDWRYVQHIWGIQETKPAYKISAKIENQYKIYYEAKQACLEHLIEIFTK